MDRNEIRLEKLLSCMPAAERVEVSVKGEGGAVAGYVPEVREKFKDIVHSVDTIYVVTSIYSDYAARANESYTIIEVEKRLRED